MALASRENRLARDEAITPQRSEEAVLDMTLNCPSQNGGIHGGPSDSSIIQRDIVITSVFCTQPDE